MKAAQILRTNYLLYATRLSNVSICFYSISCLVFLNLITFKDAPVTFPVDFSVAMNRYSA